MTVVITTRFKKQFKEIITITLEVQQRGLSLADARLALNVLIDFVENRKKDLQYNLHNCTLDKFYPDPNPPIVHFESDFPNIYLAWLLIK